MTQEVPRLSRRAWLHQGAAAIATPTISSWFGALASGAAEDPARRRSCILLWMTGAPSQLDTFDLKPGHKNGGPFREIATAAPGMRFCEHLPKLAAHAKRITLVRSMTGREGDHTLATEFAHTGYPTRGAIKHPAIGAIVAKEAQRLSDDLPGFVSVAPARAFAPAAHLPGFLGPAYAPFVIAGGRPGNPEGNDAVDRVLAVENLKAAVGLTTNWPEARLQLAQQMQREFAVDRPGIAPGSHLAAYDQAARLMSPAASRAFRLTEEPEKVRDAYGRTLFGQGCLMARRLIERGVPFVEVAFGGQSGADWDTHVDNFESVRRLSGVLDAGWSALLQDLSDRGLLENTLVVWAGEFGRTPKINSANGRDHFPDAWTVALSGGGVSGGQVIGRTSAGGEAVEDRPVTVPNLLATVCRSVGIDPAKQYESNTGRPISIVDGGAQPIAGVLV